jgi:hypothetical protein
VELDEAYDSQEISDTEDAGVQEVFVNGVVTYLTTNNIFTSMTDLALSSYDMLNKRMVDTPGWTTQTTPITTRWGVFHRPGHSIDQEHESK